jgi:dethiobiotin synthetase
VLLGSATECELLGSLSNNLNKPLNLKDFQIISKNTTLSNKPLIAVLGTGIDSGKTTVSSFLIKSISNYIQSISACKLAGTASQKDLYSYEDSGANNVYDFVDYGLPSTCQVSKEEAIESSVSIVNEASKNHDLVFIELGDGYHGQYGTKEIIETKQISENIKVVIICAYDVSGAVNILESLDKFGLKKALTIISGPVTNNITAFRESLDKFGTIKSEYLNIYNNVNHANIFAKIINKVKDD